MEFLLSLFIALCLFMVIIIPVKYFMPSMQQKDIGQKKNHRTLL